ncbi:MAG: histidine phosphatase family protein [Chloroflexota bacterium]|nr:histidine phosphatase family protein [Chloroflexota bacterium]
MKTLTIIRHAKAEPPDDYANDFDRPLTLRGGKDAKHIGKVLARLAPPVDWLISSPALRTRETAEQLVIKLGYKETIVWSEAVYLAEAETLLTVLSEAPQDKEHVVLIGHNPGMEGVVAGLCTGAAAHLNLAMPTAALAHLHLEIFWWNQIRWGCGQLQVLVTPKVVRE